MSCSRGHQDTCSLVLHAVLFKSHPGDSTLDTWTLLVTDGNGRRVIEKPDLANGTTRLILEPPPPEPPPAPGPQRFVSTDPSADAAVVWVGGPYRRG